MSLIKSTIISLPHHESQTQGAQETVLVFESLGCQGSGLNTKLVTLLHIGQQEPFAGEQVNKLFGFDEEKDLSFPLGSLLKQLNHWPVFQKAFQKTVCQSASASLWIVQVLRGWYRWIRSIHTSLCCCCITLYSSSLQIKYKNNFVSYTFHRKLLISVWKITSYCHTEDWLVSSTNDNQLKYYITCMSKSTKSWLIPKFMKCQSQISCDHSSTFSILLWNYRPTAF